MTRRASFSRSRNSVSVLHSMLLCDKVAHSWDKIVRQSCRCDIGLSRSMTHTHARTHAHTNTHTHTHTHTHDYTRVSRYQKSKTNLDFTGARYSEWQWHQLSHMQICTSLQTDNHASTPPLSTTQFLQAGCRSCRPTNSVKAQKAPSTSISCR